MSKGDPVQTAPERFADEALSDDKFLCGRLRLLQPIKGYRAATDPVLMAAATPARAGERVLDLGCGAGAASLCLAARVPGLIHAGLELQPAYADLARRNGARNGVALEVVEGSVTRMPAELRREFDHVICNPPWYPAGGTPSPLAWRATAMQVELSLTAWMDAGARRLAPGGWLTMITGTDSLPELLAAMGTRLGSAVVLPLAAREGREARRIILRARKGGRAAFRLLPPLVLHRGAAHDGDRESYTPQAEAVLRGGEGLEAAFR